MTTRAALLLFALVGAACGGQVEGVGDASTRALAADAGDDVGTARCVPACCDSDGAWGWFCPPDPLPR